MTVELRTYIENTTPRDDLLHQAVEYAHEFGLNILDTITGHMLTTLTASCHARGAIAITPAVSVVGLYILRGLAENGILTCIEPEPEYQKQAKAMFREAGYGASRIRFLPSRPLEVMGRLAAQSYNIIYGEIAPIDLIAFVDAALPLLTSGGSIILPDVLFDGTLADLTRKDRDTVAARKADTYIQQLTDVHITRLPLGAGTTIITKK